MGEMCTAAGRLGEPVRSDALEDLESLLDRTEARRRGAPGEIYVCGEIDDRGRMLVRVLTEALEAGRGARVWLCSPGGDVANALAIADMVTRLEAEVIATGQCMSAALLVLLAGKKRLATPNTLFLTHAIQEIDGVPIADVPAIQRLKKLPRGHFDVELAKTANLIDEIYRGSRP